MEQRSEDSPEPLIQRSPEWFAARCGKVTASKIGDILRRLKNGNFAASRRNYCAQLANERITGRPTIFTYTNEHMERGKDLEPAAREKYVSATGAEITELGFVEHPRLPHCGASPDGLVGDKGLLEIKCLIKANHMDLLLSEDMSDYELQMHWQLACMPEREFVDFVSFNDEMRDDMQLLIKRLDRDDEKIIKIEREVSIFLEEVDELVHDLKRKFGESSTTN